MVRKLVFVGLGALVALAAAGAAVYFFWDALLPSSAPENNAGFYPKNVIAYSWVTLNPGEGQRRHMLDLFNRLGDLDEFDDYRDRFTDDMESETDIDFENDIAPWIGWDMSAALVDADPDRESVEFAATVGVRDADAAAKFLDEWLVYVADESGAEFKRDSYGDFSIWDDEGKFQVYALSDKLMAFATTRDLMDDTLDRVVNGADSSLADNAEFQEARGALPDRRFASFYVDVDRALDLADELSAPSALGVPGGGFLTGDEYFSDSLAGLCGGDSSSYPGWMAGSLGWIERGLVFELATPSIGGDWPRPPELADVAENLPADTVAAFAMSFNPALDEWREWLGKCDIADFYPDYDAVMDEIAWNLGGDMYGQVEYHDDRTLADALDTSLRIVELALGTDLEQDFMNHLRGDFALAVREFDLSEIQAGESDEPVELMALVSYRAGSEGDLATSMADAAGEVSERTGVEAAGLDVGADNDAYVFDGLVSAGAYAPGYVIHNDYMTMAATEGTLEAVVDTQNREGDSLAADGEYRRAVAHLRENRWMFGFVNIYRIVSGMDRADAGLSRSQFELLRSLSASGLSFSSADGRDRLTVALTLFGEGE